MSEEESKNKNEEIKTVIVMTITSIQLLLVSVRDKVISSELLFYGILMIVIFMAVLMIITVVDTRNDKQEIYKNRQQNKDIAYGDKEFSKIVYTTKSALLFSQNYFTYHISTEQMVFPFSKIHKIILFGSNPKTQSLNIYYDTDKVYTFYSDMEEWSYLLTKLASYYKFAIQNNENKQILYQSKIS